MRALLLAAGFGTRLQPLTNYIPKCLVPIHGRPILDYWLEVLLNNGIEKVLVNTHYMAPMVQEFIKNSTWKKKVVVTNEKNLLGTGGTILKNKDFFCNQPFMVAHADNLTLFDIQQFIFAHKMRPHTCELTMMIFETDEPKSCGIVKINSQGIVHEFHEKTNDPPGNLANAAVYIMEPSVIKKIYDLGMEKIDLSVEVLPKLVGKIFTYRNTIYHRDIGSIRNWNLANRDFPKQFGGKENMIVWQTLLRKENLELIFNKFMQKNI